MTLEIIAWAEAATAREAVAELARLIRLQEAEERERQEYRQLDLAESKAREGDLGKT